MPTIKYTILFARLAHLTTNVAVFVAMGQSMSLMFFSEICVTDMARCQVFGCDFFRVFLALVSLMNNTIRWPKCMTCNRLLDAPNRAGDTVCVNCSSKIKICCACGNDLEPPSYLLYRNLCNRHVTGQVPDQVHCL